MQPISIEQIAVLECRHMKKYPHAIALSEKILENFPASKDAEEIEQQLASSILAMLLYSSAMKKSNPLTFIKQKLEKDSKDFDKYLEGQALIEWKSLVDYSTKIWRDELLKRLQRRIKKLWREPEQPPQQLKSKQASGIEKSKKTRHNVATPLQAAG
jgi:hypothetical protein